MENEIRAAQKFLENYCKNGCLSVVTSAWKIAENLEISCFSLTFELEERQIDYKVGDENTNFLLILE